MVIDEHTEKKDVINARICFNLHCEALITI